MSIPQTKPQSFEDVMASINRDLSVAVDADLARSPRLAADRPPASSAGPAPVEMWGPSTPPVTTPLALLEQVAQNAQSLAQQAAALVSDVTGEQPNPPRQREPLKRRGGLLPAVAHYATEIADAHAEIARQLVYIRERLS